MRRNYGVRNEKHFAEYVNERYKKENIGKKTKARHYVWMIATSAMIAFIGVVSKFMERCQTSLIFSTISFKTSCMLFATFICFSFICLTKVRIHKDHYIYFLWHEQKALSIITILLAASAIILFTYAIWPAYEEASIVFATLGTLFLANLACVILYD